MPLSDRLVHSLAIVTPTDSGTVDDRNQPVAGEPRVELVRGFLWPMNAREVSQASDAGAELANHAIVFALRDVSPAAYIRFQPDDGVRYQVQGVAPHNFGRDPLVLVWAQRLVPSTLPAEAS